MLVLEYSSFPLMIIIFQSTHTHLSQSSQPFHSTLNKQQTWRSLIIHVKRCNRSLPKYQTLASSAERKELGEWWKMSLPITLHKFCICLLPISCCCSSTLDNPNNANNALHKDSNSKNKCCCFCHRVFSFV